MPFEVLIKIIPRRKKYIDWEFAEKLLRPSKLDSILASKFPMRYEVNCNQTRESGKRRGFIMKKSDRKVNHRGL